MAQQRLGKHATLGVCFLAIISLLVSLAIAKYNQAFRSYDSITIEADRSGLLLTDGARVKYRGVEVGQVGQVVTVGDRARVSVELEPDKINGIPANVGADLIPPTVFGAKYVRLTEPAQRTSGAHLQPGTVISGAQVTTEVNNLFSSLMRTLAAMKPHKVSSALNSVAELVRGRGAEMGRLVQDLDKYLRIINPHTQGLSDDLPKATDVSHSYADATDDFSSTGENLGRTSDSVVDKQAELGAFALSLTKFGNTSDRFLSENEQGLVTTLDVLRPTLGKLEQYSPELPCLLGGFAANGKYLRAVMGGPDHGGTHRGVHYLIGLLPGKEPYQYPDDLPHIGADTGPDCHGLPNLTTPAPYVPYPTGTNAHPGNDNGLTLGEVSLANVLFGLDPRREGGTP